MSQLPLNNKHWASDIFFLAIGISIFYLVLIGAHHLISPDETRYVGIAWEMWKENNYITPKLEGSPFLGKPILFYWLEILAFNIFGVSEYAARFFPAVMGIFTSLFTYISLRTLKDRKTGFIAAISVACTPLYFVLTHYANMDGEVGSWVTCSALALLVGANLPEKTTKRAVFLYLAYIFGAAAFLTKGLIGLVFPAGMIFFWMLFLNRWDQILKLKLITGLILVIILIMPWMILCNEQNPGFISYFFIWNQFDRFLGNNFNMHQPWYFYIGPVIASIFPFTLFWIQALKKNIKDIITDKHKSNVELFCLIWFVMITIFFSIPESKLIGYISSAIPGTAIFMALYFAKIWGNTLSRANIISSWIVVAIYLILSIGLVVLLFVSDNPGVQASAPYIWILSISLIFSAIIYVYILLHRPIIKYIYFCLIVPTIIILLCIMADLKNFTLQYNWPIAAKVEQVLKKYPNAKIYMYGQFYYAIPMYLGREIPTVSNWNELKLEDLGDNWQREIYIGLKNPKKLPSTLMIYPKFKNIWESNTNSPIIVIIDNDSMKNFNRLIGHNYHILGTVPHRSAIILGNDNININN